MSDFQEHLRQVHFTLTLLCLITLIARTPTSEAKSVVALHQLEGVARLQARWDSGRWIEDELARVAASWALESDSPNAIVSVGLSFEAGEPSPLVVPVDVPEFCLGMGREFGERMLCYYRGEAGSGALGPLRTLRDFRSFWDSVGETQRLFFPTRAVVAQVTTEDGTPVKTTYMETSLKRAAMRRLQVDPRTMVVRPVGEGGMPVIRYPNDFAPCTGSVFEYFGLDGHLEASGCSTKKLPKVGRVLFGLNFASRPFDARSVLATAAGMPWSNTSASRDIVAELIEQAGDRADREITSLKSLLEVEATSPDRQLDFLGASIPVSALEIWGLVALVVVQTYLAIHLHEYLSVARGGGQGQPFPWMGLYKGLAPRAVTALSIAGLPIVVAVHLAFFSPHRQPIGVALAAGAIALAVTLQYLMIRIWRQDGAKHASGPDLQRGDDALPPRSSVALVEGSSEGNRPETESQGGSRESTG